MIVILYMGCLKTDILTLWYLDRKDSILQMYPIAFLLKEIVLNLIQIPK